MEELLNKLIEKGWKPRGNNEWKKIVKNWGFYNLHRYVKHIALPSRDLSLRNFVSKESWLWQFCCENKFVKTKDRKVRYMYEDLERTQNYFSWYWYEYRIIESALCNEEDLEKFLLDNIKI